MPTFDIVSEVEQQEITNAVDQANRELKNRFDFKGIDAIFDLKTKGYYNKLSISNIL